jgi:hypothetical protein
MSDVERSVAEASKLLAHGAGDLNLQMVKHKLSRSSLIGVAESARQAAAILDDIVAKHAP